MIDFNAPMKCVVHFRTNNPEHLQTDISEFPNLYKASRYISKNRAGWVYHTLWVVQKVNGKWESLQLEDDGVPNTYLEVTT